VCDASTGQAGNKSFILILWPGSKKNNLTGQATNINKKLHHWKQL